MVPWYLRKCRLSQGNCRGIGTRVASPKRKKPFKTKMGRLGCSWAELSRCTADCRRQPAVPIANSRPRRNRPILLSTKTVSRLARSWAEIALAWPIAVGQSTVPRANSRPRRSRHTSSSGKVDPGAVGGASTRSFNARSREIRVAENPSHIRDLTAVRC